MEIQFEYTTGIQTTPAYSPDSPGYESETSSETFEKIYYALIQKRKESEISVDTKDLAVAFAEKMSKLEGGLSQEVCLALKTNIRNGNGTPKPLCKLLAQKQPPLEKIEDFLKQIESDAESGILTPKSVKDNYRLCIGL